MHPCGQACFCLLEAVKDSACPSVSGTKELVYTSACAANPALWPICCVLLEATDIGFRMVSLILMRVFPCRH